MSGPFDFFSYRNNVLHAEKVPLPKIADATGTPVYVYSTEGLLKPLRALQQGLASVDHLVCFAVKANSNVAVLKLLGNAGAGMDLVSGGELFRTSCAGISPQKVVFSGVGKTPGEMAMAIEKGIFSFNVESSAELEMLSSISRSLKKKAPVALRFNPDVNPKTHPYISTGLKENKFGISRSEVLSIARNLSRYPGVEIKGISIHIGSQLLSLRPLKDAFGRVRELLDTLDGILPRPISYVDLGGGIGVTYKKENPPELTQYCALILKHFGPGAGLPRPLKILIEPGRAISGNAGILLTEVLYRKSRSHKDFLVINAAMNDLLRPALYGSYHEIVPVEKSRNVRSLRKTDVVGPVCESSDCFASGRPLPAHLKGSDLLAILSAGAYGFTMSSNYNTRPRPPEVLVQGTEFKVIREREDYKEMVRDERF